MLVNPSLLSSGFYRTGPLVGALLTQASWAACILEHVLFVVYAQVCSFAFRDGRVFFRNRFVRTEALLAEQAAQRMLYRGAFRQAYIPLTITTCTCTSAHSS